MSYKYIVFNGWRINEFDKKWEYLSAKETRKEYGLPAWECLYADFRKIEWWIKYFPELQIIKPKELRKRKLKIDYFLIRVSAGLSIKQVADLAGISYNKYKNIEMGRTEPTLLTFKRILLAFNLGLRSKVNCSHGGQLEVGLLKELKSKHIDGIDSVE